ncbi:MAG: DUF962 domain-containing protein [Polyangiales bacterium]
MADDRIRSFEDFWPHYVRAHSNKANRTLHFVGTSAAMLLAGTGLVTGQVSLILAAPIVGYGCAWFGHFVLEGNKPATFGHPLWSLAGDFVMWKKVLDGTMDAEVEKHVRDGAVAEAQTTAAPAHSTVN